MLGPSATDWSFGEVAKADVARSKRLQTAPTFETIVAQVRAALSDAIANKHFRCGVDFYLGHQRAIFQFRIRQDLYDRFFNSRTGYRAQYWISPERGQAANTECLQALSPAIMAGLPDCFEAREIQTEDNWAGRKDTDVGGRDVARSFFMDSFTHPAAKIWICERLIGGQTGPLQSIPISQGSRLCVPRWPTALALCPKATLAWLDLKGGFVGGNQPKDSCVRARDINKQGFS